MREIALDTETTGLKPSNGHRIIEVGCVEMINRIATGNYFHAYIDPERDVPKDAFDIHGISNDFLKGKPVFSAIADDLLEFIGDSKLVIHNAAFDMAFLNAELTWAKKKEISRSKVFCTLIEARNRFPGAPSSLDALCKRFGIDLSARAKHGALLDAELLSDVYLELMGGVQVSLELKKSPVNESKKEIMEDKKILPARKFDPTEEELKAHQEFLKKIKEPVWAG